jgi:hypothetical protein
MAGLSALEKKEMKITTHEAAGNQIPPQPMFEFWAEKQAYARGLGEIAAKRFMELIPDEVLIRAASQQAGEVDDTP